MTDEPHLKPAHEPALQIDDVVINSADVELLRAIDATGSLNAAATSLERSYSRVHGRIVVLEEALGPLTDRQRGGRAGGGTQLTDAASEVIAAFDQEVAELGHLAQLPVTIIEGTVTDFDPPLSRVSTAAGTIQAKVPTGATDIDLVIRGDSVVLRDPASSPLGTTTSPQNVFEGIVHGIDRAGDWVVVQVDVGANRHLQAVITAESCARLRLAPERPIHAAVKASAIRTRSRNSPSQES